MEKFKRIDYSKWQKTEEERKSPARRLTLPPLTSGDKKKGQKKKPVAFMLSKKPPLPSETSSSQEKYGSFTQRKLTLKKAELAKTLEEIKIATRVKAMVQTFNQKQLDTARAELREVEKTMEKNLGKLQQQLDEVTSKVQVLQDELSILRTYIDGQYPEQAVQIVLLQRSIQNLKEQQQGERDKTEAMGKATLAKLEENARAEQEALLQKVVEEMLLHQDGLKQMVINNHVLRHEILREREIIKDLEKEISELKRSIQSFRQSARDPRELIFADVFVFHRRPKDITIYPGLCVGFKPTVALGSAWEDGCRVLWSCLRAVRN
ncbi:uncharacterized protein C20orf96 homolog isoform X4 [Phalacrocorax carbo]|uniref:uncharacterized protein C20orf96 homolog isoform X4 n=1 Tax=Phalacrocorax carbo TaxID=9209 RepID=UPI00311A7B20